MNFEQESHFLNIHEAIQRATVERNKIDPEKHPKYHLPYLNTVLGGIAKSELVVIGAETGMGKSSIARHLAYENAKAGKNVYLFSLEGHKNEVINSLKWRIICREYYADKKGRQLRMSFHNYEMNNLAGIEDEDALAAQELQETLKTLHIYDRSTRLDSQKFMTALSGVDDADLVIVDHLHYFDMIEKKTEAENITEIMHILKAQTESYHDIPIVLVSHLRKRDHKAGAPDNVDFMGSSNIAKIATTCIMISPFDGEKYEGADKIKHENDEKNGIYHTVMQVTKSRSGAPRRYAGIIRYDSRTNSYLEGCVLAKVSYGQVKILKSNEIPPYLIDQEPTVDQMKQMYGI